ncbi:MAG: electron transfer flavoprotein-ubiquinone oxidoreductase [Planctomycetes bacterium]|nr:electron transfer flavoprotein-ubiquinone oxidoreductase [Planctomycetota bacterium]
MAERETLEVDVLVVGGGVAGLACAINIHERVGTQERLNPDRKPQKPNILVIEKGIHVGAHALSGCVLDVRGLDELIYDWRHQKAPIKQQVTDEEVAMLTPWFKAPLPPPLIPPYLRNEGNFIVSLGDVTAWMGAQAKKRGIEVLEGVPGAELLTYGDTVLGVQCGDSGVGKDGKPTANFQPGARIHARVTVFAEGVRGSLTKKLVKQFKLDADRNPQTYATGVKELWELPEGAFPAGKVLHTLGYPLQHAPHEMFATDAFGGSFLYGLDETHLAIGLVGGLDYHDPSLDIHNEFQRLKLHPAIKPILEKGKMVAYGAKAIPEGGYYSMPRFYGNGFVIVGDAASFLNAARLKGAHLAIKSGMLAGEAIVEALLARDYSAKRLGRYEDLFQTSWAKEELFSVRNWRQAYANGMYTGALNDLAQRATGGRGITDPLTVQADHANTELLERHHPDEVPPQKVKPDGKITFDKVTSVYHSGTVHEENQPCHLVVPDLGICVHRCTKEYGNPCQNFCPAGVYEWIPPLPTKEFGAQFGEHNKGHLQINAGNCVHCKTCDIKDPYENITWVTPEGGGGPRYQKL